LQAEAIILGTADLTHPAGYVFLQGYPVPFLKRHLRAAWLPSQAMRPTISWPRMWAVPRMRVCWCTSLPQTPVASTCSRPASGGTSGMGYSRTSKVLGAIIVDASMCSAIALPRARVLCPSFSMRAHVDGDDLVCREPGCRTHQLRLA